MIQEGTKWGGGGGGGGGVKPPALMVLTPVSLLLSGLVRTLNYTCVCTLLLLP